jgi:signal transduction histidine kinase
MMASEQSTIADLQGLKHQLAEAAAKSPELAALLPQVLQSLERLDSLERDYAGELLREKLASMQALAYGASHEINNPLANIAARAQTLLTQERDPQRRRSLATINAQAFRAHEMIADLMLFAKPPAPRMASVDLAALADQVVAELAEAAAAQGTNLSRLASGSTHVHVQADEVQIGVALRALCQNALEAVRRDGHVRVSASDVDGVPQLQVTDSGPGLTAEVRKHLFDPFYSGREAGRGLGLGLSKVWRIMELHGGQVLVDSQPERGTTFALVFRT